MFILLVILLTFSFSARLVDLSVGFSSVGYTKKNKPLKVLSSEIDPAEIRLIR